jgi:hypothetical protein
VDARAVLKYFGEEKIFTLPGLELRLLDHQTCRHSLFRLLYRGSSSRFRSLISLIRVR